MKIDIVFEKNADVDAPCWAKTQYQGETIHALGKTWKEAEDRLMAKVEAWTNAEVPPPKTVEIKDDEMDTELFPWEQKASREIEAGKV